MKRKMRRFRIFTTMIQMTKTQVAQGVWKTQTCLMIRTVIELIKTVNFSLSSSSVSSLKIYGFYFKLLE
jgi:hypothetical protein